MRNFRQVALAASAIGLMIAGVSATSLASVVEMREPPVKLRYENTPTTRRGAGPSRHAKTIANRAKRARARLSRKKG